MPARRVCLIIGILGLNICLLSAQDLIWEQHLAKARSLRARAMYKEAEQEYLAAVKEAEAFGAKDPRLARSWNNLAANYQDAGRYLEAEALLRRALAAREKALGPDHSELPPTLGNLGLLCRLQGRFEEAERLYRRSLAIRQKSLGPRHPHVAISLNNLAELQQLRGESKEAE